MKRQIFNPAFAVVAAGMLAFTACDKKPVTAPVPDKEFQSSVDASYALFCITDAEQIQAYIAENYLSPAVYESSPHSAYPSVPVQNQQQSPITFAFDADHDVLCKDARIRRGSVILMREPDLGANPNANANAIYYRRFGYAGKMTLNAYMVDGWKIVTTDADNVVDGQPCLTLNNLTSANYNGAISWSIKGNFKFQKDNQMMFCKVDLTKTLVNASDPTVYPSNTNNAINWNKAVIAYSGKMTGNINGVPFSMTINDQNPLVRDFTCYPNQVQGVGIGNGNQVTTERSEFHPFVKGVAYLTTADLYPREINYAGSESDYQCDNSGVVVIKGISYPVDFK